MQDNRAQSKQLDLDVHSHLLKGTMYSVTISPEKRPVLIGNNRKKLFEQILRPNKLEYSNGRRWIVIKTTATFYRCLGHKETRYRINGGQSVRIEDVPTI